MSNGDTESDRNHISHPKLLRPGTDKFEKEAICLSYALNTFPPLACV